MSGVIDYGRFGERLRSVMPRWGERERIPPAEFTAHLADTAPRWELLRSFQEEWGYEVPADAVPWQRWSESEHKLYLRRLRGEEAGEGDDDPFESVDLSLPVPAALDEWWELPFNSFTHSPRLYWTNPEYPPTLRPDPGGYGVAGGLPDDSPLVPAGADRRVCVFKAEYEYCNEWGYPAAEAGLPDPRVLVSVSEKEWVLQAGSLSEFFLQLAVQRLPSHYGWTVYGDDDTERIVSWVEEELPALGFRPWRELGRHITVYGAPDALVFHDTGHGDFELTVHGRTAEALESLGARMGLDWSDRIRTPSAVREAPKPIALLAGDTDENGRWTVLSRSPETVEPGTGTSPASDGDGSWTVSGTLAVTSDENGTLRARRLDGDAVPLLADPQAGPATALACIELPDEGPLIASGHRDGTLYLWMPDSDEGPLQVARQRPALTGLALTAVATGTVLAACWRDDVVALWDIASGERADLDLGPGITGLRLDTELRLTVGGPSGHAVVQLDADALWPARELMLRVVSFEDAACARDGDPEAVPRHLAKLLSCDADDARRAITELDLLLDPRRGLCSAAVLAFVYLTQIGSAVGVGAHPCHVRRQVLGLALRVVRAMHEGEGHWHGVGRQMLGELPSVLPDMMEEEDPATRTAGALLVAALPERAARADVLLRALSAGDPHPEVSAAAALALGDATAVDALVPVGWERADVEWLPRGR
ncbi:WD40 repeat domain-containing protein [Streptomyces sp. NPDC052301]|uniref:WD40 repeat domain-containing protein n=1 Tax=Streptomyces sp. NPDC052301 TaxID=3365687 RepID=UPI0037D46DD2